MPSRGYGNEMLWKHRENWSQSGTPRGVCGVETKSDTTRQASGLGGARVQAVRVRGYVLHCERTSMMAHTYFDATGSNELLVEM